MPDVWTWDDTAKRYRNPATGRFLAAAKLVELRDLYIERKTLGVSELAGKLAGGEITLNQWTLQMRETIKTTYLAEYELAVGGRKNMTQADFGRVGGLLKRQYEFLDRFAQDIAGGNLTEGQIGVRSGMYIDSASQAFERGKTAVRGMPNLPQYPGDGNTPCKANCHCTWEIEDTENGWNCTWTLHPAEHCEGCVENAQRWNPLFVPATVGVGV